MRVKKEKRLRTDLLHRLSQERRSPNLLNHDRRPHRRFQCRGERFEVLQCPLYWRRRRRRRKSDEIEIESDIGWNPLGCEYTNEFNPSQSPIFQNIHRGDGCTRGSNHGVQYNAQIDLAFDRQLVIVFYGEQSALRTFLGAQCRRGNWPFHGTNPNDGRGQTGSIEVALIREIKKCFSIANEWTYARPNPNRHAESETGRYDLWSGHLEIQRWGWATTPVQLNQVLIRAKKQPCDLIRSDPNLHRPRLPPRVRFHASVPGTAWKRFPCSATGLFYAPPGDACRPDD